MNTGKFIHNSSYIDEGVKIGEGTQVWHFCHVMNNARIGSNCILGQNVFIGKDVTVGNGVKIQNNVSVYEGVKLEDEVFVGPSVVFTNVINPRSFIERKSEFKTTLIRKGATIGANSTIVCGVEIGEYAMVGAGTLVNKNVPDYALMIGNPGRQIGWVSRFGRRLDFDEKGLAFSEDEGVTYILKNNAVSVVV